MTRLAPGTISDNPWLREIFAADTAANAHDYLEHAVFNDGKEEVYYSVLKRMVGREVTVRRAPIDVLLLPAFDLSRRETEIVLLPPDKAQSIVLDRLLHDKPLPEWLPLIPRDQLEAADATNSRALAGRLPPVYEIRFGSYETRPAEVVLSLLAGLRRSD